MTVKKRISLFAICVAVNVCAVAGTAHAHSAQSGDITVGHIWSYPPHPVAAQPGSYSAPATPGGLALDIYGPIVNGGGAQDAVTGITSTAGTSAGIVMWVRGSQFTRAFPLDLPPGKPVALGPETQFIRIYGVSSSYKDGDHVPVTFHFEHAGDAKTEVIVQGK
jgi:copper(I)-binding protein